MATKTFLSNYGEWIFRTILLLGIGLNLWLTQSFVTRGEFYRQIAENKAEHLQIQTSVADIATTMKILISNVSRLDDHEIRLRIISDRQIQNTQRLDTIDKILDKKTDLK